MRGPPNHDAFHPGNGPSNDAAALDELGGTLKILGKNLASAFIHGVLEIDFLPLFQLNQALRGKCRRRHGDQVAGAIGLDMAAHWTPTVENYLGRITKTRILEAVREAKGDAAAQLIDHLKKPEMAREAERLLAGTGCLPEPLRLAEPEVPGDAGGAEVKESLPAFLHDEQAPAAPMADAAE